MRNFLNRYGKLHFIVHTMIFIVALVIANSVIQLTLINMAHAASRNLIASSNTRSETREWPDYRPGDLDDQIRSAMTTHDCSRLPAAMAALFCEIR